MPFKKGNKGGPGMPKGTKHIKTQQWEELGEFIITKGAARYMGLLATLEDPEFLERFERIIEYFKPKQARLDGNVTHDVEVDVTHTYIPRKTK